jgi:hypothetical protein
VQRHEPGLAEFRVAHDEHRAVEVEILIVESDRLADPHAAHREQAYQAVVGGRPQRGTQPGRRVEQRDDLAGGIQIRSRPARPGPQQPRPAAP